MSGRFYQTKRLVTLVGALTNLVIGIGKVIAGYAGQSQALIADGIHSVSDLAGDAIVLAAARFGSAAPDRNHPYGHARIETAATVAIGLLLLVIAGGFVWSAGQRLLQPETLWQPGWIALAAALLSMLAKEVLFHYTHRAARRTGSALLEANAWHHRSDALSSVVVVVGVTGTMAGLPWLDAVAAIVVAAMIARMGWQFGLRGLAELVDTGLEEHHLKELEQRIRTVEGVRSHGRLRSRRMGSDILTDVPVRVSPRISITEARHIGEKVRRELLNALDELAEVLVEVEPEHDQGAQEAELPDRSRVLKELQPLLEEQGLAAHQVELVLHYGDARLDMDLILPAGKCTDRERGLLQQGLREKTRGTPWLGTIRVLHPDC